MWVLPPGLTKRQIKRQRDKTRLLKALEEDGDCTSSQGAPIEYGPDWSGSRRRKGRWRTLAGWVWGIWKGFVKWSTRGVEVGRRHRLSRLLKGWYLYQRSGGFARAEIVDEEEELFLALDPSPV